MGVTLFLRAHALEERAGRRVFRRKPSEVILEVADDPPFGLFEVAEARPIAEESEERAAQPAPRVPDGTEKARPRTEGRKAAAATEEVGFLFRSAFVQPRREFRAAGEERLSPVERLGRHFAGVVDTDEARDAGFRRRIETALGGRGDGGAGEDRGERVIELLPKAVAERGRHGGAKTRKHRPMIRPSPRMAQ